MIVQLPAVAGRSLGLSASLANLNIHLRAGHDLKVARVF